MHLAEHVLLWWPMEENSCTVVATMKLVLGKTPKKRETALLNRFRALDLRVGHNLPSLLITFSY